jgi:DNA polymerase III epsilon subunit-like protein
MPLVLIFDVETTGLLPKRPTDKFPHITQLSFALYDILTNEVVQIYDQYICPPDDVEIPDIVTRLTGINREKLDKEGINIKDALAEFHKAYDKADKVVAHNALFDEAVIYHHAELPLKAEINKKIKNIYCTMHNSIDLCKMQRYNSRGVYYKYPTLTELYIYLFKMPPPDNMHNSKIDVLCCLRCYLAMNNIRIFSENEFQSLLGIPSFNCCCVY